MPYPTFSNMSLSGLVRDAGGTLWGEQSGGNLPFYRKTSTGWEPVDAGVKATQYTTLTIGDDGKMYALLNDAGSSQGFVVRFTNDGATTIGSFPVDFNAPPLQLLVTSDGSAFVTGKSLKVRHILGHGKPDVIDTIPAEAFGNGAQPQDGNICTIAAASDGHNRVWFYSKNTMEPWLPAMKEVVIWNNGTLNPIQHLLGTPGGSITQLVMKDKDHLWAIYEPGYLCTIDTRTLNGERIDGPAGSPMRGVKQIERDGSDWLIVNSNAADTSSNPLSTSLWRLHEGAKSARGWTKVISNLQPDGYEMSIPVPICATRSGVWAAVAATGVWWAPRNGAKPTLLDWKRGFPQSITDALVRLDDTHAIVLASDTLPIVVSDKPAPLLPPSDLNFVEERVTNTGSALQPDSRAHLWGVRRSGSTGLDEWDGWRWISHPLPPKLERASILTLIADNSDRIWCFRSPESQVEIYDTRTDRWTDYPNLKAAFEAHRADPAFAFRPEWSDAPKIVGNKVAAFWNTIVYFDGSEWHSWSQTDVSKTEYIDPHPYLNDAGQLSLYGDQHIWLWNGKTWNEGAKLEHGIPNPAEKTRLRVTDELQNIGFFSGSNRYVGYATAAPHGDWFFIGSHLYAYRSGMARETFPDGQRNPYLQLSAIDIVREDAAGHIWLGTNASNTYRFIRLQPNQAKPITLNIASQTADGVRINIGGGDSSLVYEWRIDDTAVISGDRSKNFTNVMPGRHTISVTPLTPRLVPTAPAATLQWKSTITPNEQITNLIAQLNTGTDAERSAAADALDRYGDAAVPALKAGRGSATETGKWWIDSALQTIEEQKSSTQTTLEVAK